MKGIYMLVALAAGAAAPMAALAQESNGATGIVRGDYRSAEREIERQRRFAPHDVDLLVNLASVYRRTGRDADARLLYRQILGQPDEPLDVAGRRPIGSHALATGALAALESR